ncbi:MAG: uroporphyrinogen decarboxylase family protein [bacterium]
MNSLERTRSAIRSESVDYAPGFPILIAPACQLVGVKLGDYFQEPTVMAETLIEARALCGFDGIYVSRDNWVYHEAMGGEMVFPEDDESYGPSPVLLSIKEFGKLKIPDPWRAAGMQTVLSAARKVVEQVGGEFYIQANIDCGPFSLGGVLRGIEEFMMDCVVEEAGLIQEYLEFCTEVVIAYGKAMIGTGVHGVQFGDSVSSLVGVDMFERLVLPYEQKTSEGLKSDRCDLWVHICGKTDHILPMVATLPIQGFELDALTKVGEARRLIGPNIALKGNLDTTFLLQETPEAVYQATQLIIKAHGSTSNLVFSPGCGVPRMTPLENLKAMVHACQDCRPGH